MSLYLDTTHKQVVAIAICDRCKMKKSIMDLSPDGNAIGLRVCKECNDKFDPWRLAARQTENITVQYPRPDDTLSV